MKTSALTSSFIPINTSTNDIQQTPKKAKSLPSAEPNNQDKVEIHSQISDEVPSKAKSGRSRSKAKPADIINTDSNSSTETKNLIEDKITQSESPNSQTIDNSKSNNTPETIAILEDEPVLSINLNSTAKTSEKAKTKGTSQSRTAKNKAQGGEAKSESFSSANEVRALREELQQQDMLRTQNIYERMSVEKQLHEAKRQAIQADLQTELQKIFREVNLRRKKVEDELNKNWQKIFLGS